MTNRPHSLNREHSLNGEKNKEKKLNCIKHNVMPKMKKNQCMYNFSADTYWLRFLPIKLLASFSQVDGVFQGEKFRENIVSQFSVTGPMVIGQVV